MTVENAYSGPNTKITYTSSPNFDKTKVGSYTITYIGSDLAGNTATRTIIVENR